jgi:hypothetical protein
MQDLMEKTITLALATGHKRFSASLSKLVENYAELLASQGLPNTAMEYLKLLGPDEHSHELVILRDRIAFSTEGYHKIMLSHKFGFLCCMLLFKVVCSLFSDTLVISHLTPIT